MSFQVAILITILTIANAKPNTPKKVVLYQPNNIDCIAMGDAHENGVEADAPRLRGRCAPHPCTQVLTTQTINTPEGRVICIVPSEQELMEQLKEEGTYNGRYMAANEEQASAFPSLLDTVEPSALPATTPHNSSLPKTQPSTTSWVTTQPTTKRRYTTPHSSTLPQTKQSTTSKDRTRPTTIPVPTTPPTKPLATVQPDGFWWWARGKRFADSKQLKANLFDSVETIRCSKKGSWTQYGLRKICTECQQARHLPIGHFPGFLNELVCGHETSNKKEADRDVCYEDYGECVQKNLYFRLLKRSNDLEDVTPAFRLQLRLFAARKALKQVYRPYDRKVRSCCECQIYADY